ncbi:MAG TPA: PASTA domain-containing protein [Terriglobales bacterium]|nr:PASTA domain-containing protein [Terriglobales bacterium]
MRAFFRFALLSLVLLAVALISALTAMRIAIHGREVTVPKLVGLTAAQADKVAFDHGLVPEVANQFYSADIPEGRMISQSPEEGAVVRRGWRVQLAQSLGPRHLEIPEVVGQSQRAAEINLRRRGLDVVTVAEAHIPAQPQDEVIAQTPAANSADIASPKAGILLALPDDPQAFVMPSLAGRPLADAVRAIQNAGLKLGKVNTVTAATPAANTQTVVIRQSPAAGQKVFPGTTVDLDAGH